MWRSSGFGNRSSRKRRKNLGIPQQIRPVSANQKNLSFGSGIHFCVGAPLARLELVTALPIIFKKFPNIKLVDQPIYSNLYHFHGLQNINVSLQN